ncbi:Acetoin dehydrogenase E1 component alpha-subunit [Georgfuchsia toluolica]|uniref:Acetoin dehydrogenase E1 component alpha-subunit n=1 Tax=Georgfuchsia toluolica TaxID=424218 RepID=A0A916J2S5_9PROT|nr:thiamine pyrophosphate-dependent dehydrogenase E1 component subunit alpha [Georgfuchsia toluolica]CAG4882768.1 Acetoin dehydrogenase E1 component alpha-subunit [Georgfuchsia toluolica]
MSNVIRKPATPAETKSKSSAKSGDNIPIDTRLVLFRRQVEARYCEKRAYDLFLQNLVKGTSHLALGQEAISAGVAVALEKDDLTFPTFRGHHHALARGVPMTAVLGELMGRECGCLAGKGGSMHLSSVDHGVMASCAILGASLPIAVGAAWSMQYRGTSNVCVAFFGDGTANIGAFHEALNLAVVWKLPVIFVCENNLYGEYTVTTKVTAVEHPAADRASAYGLERIIIDGNDADAVFTTMQTAVAKARAGKGPSMIECMTYRQSGHSRADPAHYRPPGELDEWKKKDPIVIYRQRLLDLKVPETTLKQIEQETMHEVNRATEEAKASPVPLVESAFKDVWANGGIEWRN